MARRKSGARYKNGRLKVGILGKPIPEMTQSDLERFWAKVDRRALDECWEWTAQRMPNGYGRFSVRWNQAAFYAHRVALAVDGRSPAPDEYVDHICRNRSCVNPGHLRAVDALTNSLENSTSQAYLHSLKTHCPQGHPYSGDNLSFDINGARRCRACNREQCRKQYHARKREMESA